ncbi:MAG: thioredoxin-disulfide reductase [Actinomycetota bacterium]|nr:thioredoxin-disulfide reductase [Actinomycetota bacterium]
MSNSKSKYDLIIIGGGPAGLTAGIYGARARLRTLLIEKGLTGGQIAATEEIENYPGFVEAIGGAELTGRMEKQAMRFGLEIKTLLEVESIQGQGGDFTILAGDERSDGRAVIVSTGATPAKLGIPGESEFAGRGVSYCATCDGAFFSGADVLVVGGGNAAVEEAIFLTKFARKISLVHRRDQLRADRILVERARESDKIDFILGSELLAIEGGSRVERAIIKDKKSDKVGEVAVGGVFMYVGTKPNSDFLTDILKLDEKGYIITADDLMTSKDGIFAAGDARKNGAKQVVIAAGEGALAAISAQKYLDELGG